MRLRMVADCPTCSRTQPPPRDLPLRLRCLWRLHTFVERRHFAGGVLDYRLMLMVDDRLRMRELRLGENDAD